MSQTPSVLDLARAKRVAQQERESGTLPKVLFVDDDPRILHALESLFRPRYDITVTTDGRRALEMLRQQRFHLIVSDQRMPEIEGIEVLRQARIISPATVRILLTGFADLAAIVGSVNDGEVFRYINKPWVNEELEATVAKAVEVGAELAIALSSAGTASPPGVRNESLESGAVLFIEQQHQISDMVRTHPIDGVTALDAPTPADALDVMHDREIDVAVVAVDGTNAGNLDFLTLLKKEHPYVVTIVVSDTADSAAIVSLINNARAFRVIFRPVRQGTLRLYLKSALRQADHYHHCPLLLKTQQSADLDPDTASSVSKLSALIGARISSIKHFFSRATRQRAT